MKLSENDPLLAAYAFGELGIEQAEEVAKALENQPELRKHVAELELMGNILSEGFGAEQRFSLRADQRVAIHRAGRNPQLDELKSHQQNRWQRPVLMTLAVAAALVLCVTLLQNTETIKSRENIASHDYSQMSNDELSARLQANQNAWNYDGSEGATVVSGLSAAPKNVAHAMQLDAIALRKEIELRAGGQEFTESGVSVESAWQDTSKSAIVRVPLVAGNSSWQWIRRALESHGRMPLAAEVRSEEVINSFDYHPSADMAVGGVAVSVELVQSPWQPEQMLAVLFFRSESEESPIAEAAVSFSKGMSSYRLMGYSGGVTNTHREVPATVKMKPNYEHVVVYEVQTLPEFKEGDLAVSVHLNVTGHSGSEQRSLNCVYDQQSWQSAQEDVRFVLLLSSWCHWLSSPSDKLATIVNQMLANQPTNSQQRVQAIGLIKRSLQSK